jgi:hypothetical protein
MLKRWKFWHPLAEVKNSYTFDLAKYAVHNKSQDPPAFRWWVKHTLRQSKRFIASIATGYAK